MRLFCLSLSQKWNAKVIWVNSILILIKLFVSYVCLSLFVSSVALKSISVFNYTGCCFAKFNNKAYWEKIVGIT